MVPLPTDRDLVPLDGLVGTLPSFSEGDLPLLRWVASHYVSPLSTILDRTVPPNVPRSKRRAVTRRIPDSAVTKAAVVSAAPHQTAVDASLQAMSDGSAMIIVPSMVEAETLASHLSRSLGNRVHLAHSGLEAKAVTKAWVETTVANDCILVGTREIALWPIGDLARIVVVEDSRRVMKSPSTPTLGVREIAAQRATHHGVAIDFITPLPSLEAQGFVDTIDAGTGRAWGLVEIVDRTETPPTAASVLDRTRTAVAAAVKADTSVFVLVPRRGYARAVRCVGCSHLRLCQQCGAAGSKANTCDRCGSTLESCENCGRNRWRGIGAGIGSVIEELRTVVGRSVGDSSSGRLVTVGTERDLVAHDRVGLAVAVDIDTVAMAPTYRAPEDALRLLARLSHLVERGRGHRTIVQTASPNQAVIEAVRSGTWQEFMATELRARRRAGFPPAGELIALEIGEDADDADRLIRAAAPHATVMGPASMKDRERWLIQAANLDSARVGLRQAVRTLRDRGARVRVDVDPIDL